MYLFLKILETVEGCTPISSAISLLLKAFILRGLLSKNAITKGSILDDFYDNIKKGLKPELKQY